MAGNTFTAGLLWAIPGVLVGSFLIARLILRSLFRCECRTNAVSVCVAFMPTGSIVGASLISWRYGGMDTHSLDDILYWGLAAFMPVSVLIALFVLRGIFRGERTAKLVFTSVLIAQFASALPFLTAIVHAQMPDFVPFGNEVVVLALVNAIVFLPSVLLLILWLLALLRHARSGERAYAREAWTAAVIGLCSFAWPFYVIEMLNGIE